MALFFSENPEIDLWRELLLFSYDENIKKYLSKNDLPTSEDTINCIAGSFLQAYEYFKSAKDADEQISPLLLYYGATNLLYGMVSLLSGTKNKIVDHGMRILRSDSTGFIADTPIRFRNPESGGVHVFSRGLGFEKDLTKYGDWTLREFWDSVAEINSDYIRCYGVKTGRIAFLDVFNTPDGKAEKVYVENDDKDDIIKLLSEVEGFSDSYLKAAYTEDRANKVKYYILRHKMNGRDISEKSYSGQPYLRASHTKEKKAITLPTILNMYISLFALASLCRYYPEQWSPFVTKDITGEKLLMEKFLFYARRMIPNIILNQIRGEQVQYTSNRYTEKSTIKHVGEHQVQEMIDQSIRKQLENNQITRNAFK